MKNDIDFNEFLDRMTLVFFYIYTRFKRGGINLAKFEVLFDCNGNSRISFYRRDEQPGRTE